MRKIFVSSIIWGLVFVLSACQTSQIETVELDTTASTSWGADVGSKVWLDRNFNGKKEIYEPGFAGITVNLWLDYGSDGLPDEKIDSTLTNAKGQYRFNALDPDINYIVEFVAPSGYIFSSKRVTNEINSDFDSDANGTGFTDSIDLQKGIYNFRIDAALFKGSTQPTYPKGNTRIGERVWLDANADGIKQASEKGFANVTLNLWWDKNKDNTPDEIIKTVETDAKGFYRFEGLGGNANYYLEVKAPEGYSISPKNNANAVGPYWDSDINPSSGFSDLLSLTPNTFNYTYNVGLTNQPSATELTELIASDALPDDGFGRAMDIYGNRVAVIRRSQFVPQNNAVIIFEKQSDEWIETTKISSDANRTIADVALYESTMVIISLQSNPSPQSSDSYIETYRKTANGWNKIDEFLATTPYMNVGDIVTSESIFDPLIEDDTLVLSRIVYEREVDGPGESYFTYIDIYKRVGSGWGEVESFLISFAFPSIKTGFDGNTIAAATEDGLSILNSSEVGWEFERLLSDDISDVDISGNTLVFRPNVFRSDEEHKVFIYKRADAASPWVEADVFSIGLVGEFVITGQLKVDGDLLVVPYINRSSNTSESIIYQLSNGQYNEVRRIDFFPAELDDGRVVGSDYRIRQSGLISKVFIYE